MRTLRGALLGAAALLTLGSCNLLARFSDGCNRDSDCPSGSVCNLHRHFCATPVVELCNGLDDNADGIGDEQQDFGLCQSQPQRGMCTGGRRVCRRTGAQWAITCEMQSSPTSVEDCLNGVDDDCNGLVDDGENCEASFAATRGLTVGSNDPSTGQGADAPQHAVCLSAFQLDRYEVTQQAFATFLSSLDPARISTGRPPRPLNDTIAYGTYVLYQTGADASSSQPLMLLRGTSTGLVPEQRDQYFAPASSDAAHLPIVNVTWIGADLYCRWAGKHLPTEAEFLRAARGPNGTAAFPWGTDPASCDRANVGVGGPDGGPCVGGPTSVDALPSGRSADGIFHLFGNVNEWMWDYLDVSPDLVRNNYYSSLGGGPTDAGPLGDGAAPDAAASDAGVGNWCTAYPNGPLGPTTGSPVAQPENAGFYCRSCRFARGRHYRTTDLRIGIRRVLDADNTDETVGFRCARGGAAR